MTWSRLLSLLTTARRPLVVKDFETSGLDGAPPVEYAILMIAPWQTPVDDEATNAIRKHVPAATYAATSRLNPNGPIHPGAFAKHGITPADVADAMPWNDLGLRAAFLSLAHGDPDAEGGPEGQAIWCGHNAAESDIPWAQSWGMLPQGPLPVIDTQRMQRRLVKSHPYPLHPDLPSLDDSLWRRMGWVTTGVTAAKCPAIGHGLEPYAGSLIGLHTALFGDPPEVSHGAMADVLSTAACLMAMLDLWAPLWPAAVTGEDPGVALEAMLAAINEPPPGVLSCDGWLQVDHGTGVVTWTGKAGKIGGEGTPLTADPGYADFVCKLPPSPTGKNGKAWCSPETRAALIHARNGTAPKQPRRIGQTVDTTRTP